MVRWNGGAADGALTPIGSLRRRRRADDARLPRAPTADSRNSLHYNTPRTNRMRDLILLATALASFTCLLRAQLAQPPPGVTEGVLKELMNACPANPDLADLNGSPVWSGWGGADNSRFQTKDAAGLTATDIPKLKLK